MSVIVTRTALGGPNIVEKQKFVFSGIPGGGTFQIGFGLPPDGGSGIPHRAQLIAGLTVPWDITDAGLEASIRALTTYYMFAAGGGQEAGPVGLDFFASVGVPGREPIVTAVTGGFEIQFGTLQGFPGDPTGHYNTWCQHIPLILVNDSGITYPPPPVAPVANFTADLTSGSAPLLVNFTDLSTNTPTAWAWDFGDGGTSSARSPSHSYSAPGTYTVTLTASNAAGSDGETKTAYITVSTPSPGAPVADFIANHTTGTAPRTVQFTDLSTNSPTSWAWNLGNGILAVNQNPGYTYESPGVYTVSLTATNASGSDSEIKTAYLNFTGGGGGGPPPDFGTILRDGNYLPLDAITPVRFYYTEKPTALIARQTYRQAVEAFATAGMNTPGPVVQGLATYLVEQTEPTPDDFGNFTFDRVWSTLPFSWEDRQMLEKQYQGGAYVFSGTVNPRPIVDQFVVSWSGYTKARIQHDYYINLAAVPALPVRPFIQTIRFFNSEYITDKSSGFPTRSLYGNTIFADNISESFISATIEEYMGAMVCLKTIRG